MKIRSLLLALAILCVTTSADAFCGFYVGGAGAKMFNDATNVVLLRDGTKTVLSMQNAYKGPPQKFAMVVPVPVVLHEENVKTLPHEVFDHIDQLASPRLVEYWEQDPCATDLDMDGFAMRKMDMAARAGAPMAMAESAVDYKVKVEAQFVVGEYQIVVLSAEDSGGLDAWLKKEQYALPDGAEPYFRPYIAAGSKFFVAKVDPAKVKVVDGQTMLSPLRFHYDSTDFRLPVRLGLVNSSGTQDLIVHILAQSRYEVANYPNVTIPTNLEVSEKASAEFGSFYTTLFDRTVEKNPKAVITEYAWTPTGCDPCPGPALQWSDIGTLGGDVIDNLGPPQVIRPVPVTTMGTPIPQPPPPPLVPPRRGGPFMSSNLVLTRLHARYTKESLGEDLVFREAKPIIGGRENRNMAGVLENGAKESSFNNFQARYAVRHAWKGPIDCKEPKRGVWGGPPGEKFGLPSPKAAAKLNLIPHGKADLAAFVRQDIPEIGFTASAAKKGCLGCSITGETRSTAGWLALFGLALLSIRRGKRTPSKL